jgi:hypothetical protein
MVNGHKKKERKDNNTGSVKSLKEIQLLPDFSVLSLLT